MFIFPFCTAAGKTEDQAKKHSHKNRILHIFSPPFLSGFIIKKNEASKEVSFRYVAYTWGLTVAGY